MLAATDEAALGLARSVVAHPVGLYCLGMTFGPERSSLTLADGRTLTYLSVGDPGGQPVLHHHGGLVSAGDIVPLDRPAGQAGIRLIAFDRPGIAGSTLAAGRTVLDGGADAEQLIDHLGIDEVRVMGWSMGGPYALATAFRLGPRTLRTAIIAGALPLDDPATVAELNSMDRRFTGLAGEHAELLRAAAAGLGGMARFTPSLWARAAGDGEGAADEAALRRDAESMASAAAAGTVQHEGVVEEYLAWARPWGFDRADITTPVDVWRGTEDHLLPPTWASRLADGLPHAELHVVDGVGHFLLLSKAEDVFAALLR